MTNDAVRDLDRLLARKRELAAADTAQPELESRLREVRRWQAARLARTYSDLHANPRYAAAVDFFMSDLYGTQDFLARDRDLTRAWRFMKRSLPDAPLDALMRAIELEVLTLELDHAMAAEITSGPLSEQRYADAYRAVGRRDARERQIDLAIIAGHDLARAVRHAWIGAVLRAAHAPAHAAGFGVLQDFLERGYRAFRQMGDADEFLVTIEMRETLLMRALFAGVGRPFQSIQATGSK
jgi:hypothetical protein